MVTNNQWHVEKNIFELVWNNTNDAIFTIGYDGCILSANPSFETILGWKQEDLNDDNCFPFFVNISPAEHEEQLNLFRQGQDISYHLTKRKSKDGQVLDILASYRAVNEEEVLAVGMYKDFTEQRSIQRRLEASEVCYRNLIEFIPDAVFVENNGKIVFANSSALQLAGAKRIQEMLGHSVWEFLKPVVHAAFTERIKCSLSENEPIIEQFRQVEGEAIWVEITGIASTFEGEAVIQLLLRDVTFKKNYEAQLEYLAFHDPLTGLANRRYFTEQINQAIDRATAHDEMLAFMYIDIDKFKGINDTEGHQIGDELLKQFAARLRANIRGENVLCRVGGDEFLVLIDKVKDMEMVTEIAKCLHQEFQKPYFMEGREIAATSSIGISLFPKDGENSTTLILRADEALYEAKAQRNQYQFYNQV
ncbi:sensor domain-containing diguanylate cyclase [Sporosarcina obsidiansis]|uniref:sensor domain-containing diguanylate cyclase n=1 Tax=Sporosarcina obsidiansis TaxID=2660748 RepID=UPI00129B77AC|nr:sensor domain-containing diguanylate cyclase [Sporosarcina obsidiansis]